MSPSFCALRRLGLLQIYTFQRGGGAETCGAELHEQRGTEPRGNVQRGIVSNPHKRKHDMSTAN